MEQKRQSKQLNGFTSALLILGIINAGGRFLLSIFQMIEESITVAGGIFTMILSVIGIYFLVMLLKASKIGFYGYLAMKVANIILSYALCDGDYDNALTTLIVACVQVLIIFACLCLKKNGVTGWKAIFSKDIYNR